ncbi:MAG: ATP-dependent DNA helicase [Provencibacterium sp.]|nr:ATP-dependent DNA helicase [Provencibacterium sp.]
MQEIIRLSVRSLVELLLRCGNIDNRYGGADRMAQGARIHRQLQSQAGDGYQKEVSFTDETGMEEFLFHIEGRADGVFFDEEGPVIDEIKTTAVPIGMIHEDFDLAHWGQAMCYAHFWLKQNPVKSISVRLTYFQVESEETAYFRRRFTPQQLEDFYLGLLKRYLRWARLQSEWLPVRTASLRRLCFPYALYRPGQREMAAAVYRTIQAQGRLFCQAPTGIGKTISSLFPSLKAMGEGLTGRIFYLTAKTITRRAALKALLPMYEQGMRLKSLVLTAKNKLCPLEKPDCNPEACPLADGYYDRLQEGLFEAVGSRDCFTREAVEEIAKKHRLCPYEFSLELSGWCDLIICDYNYLFDPLVKLGRLFSEKADNLYLIDEAHNLVDRAREMYSARLSRGSLNALKRAAKGQRELTVPLGKLSAALYHFCRQCEESAQKECTLPELPEELIRTARRGVEQMEGWLTKNRASPLRPDVLECSFILSFFLQVCEWFDERYAALFSAEEEGGTLRLFCLDPSAQVDKALETGRAAILFSATLSPCGYFASVLGGREKAKQYRLSSPFDRKNLCLLCADHISVKYSDRQKSLFELTGMLHALAAAREGNYLFFFPSYVYLRAAYTQFRERFPETDVLLQSPEMEEEERERFLSRFSQERSGTLCGFCVLGGIYSEGIDLKGERLIGAAIVGVGLPQIGAQPEALRRYYDRETPEGFDFAYRFPGINKVLQAAGRVVRSETDRGAVLLIDSRFSSPAYSRLFPEHWQGIKSVRSEQELQKHLNIFWQQKE